ncbi:MAG: hypothetical protein LUF68_03030, partial [Clostridiales bacterium]|nr:hypothetical protein [Clostridiales bacterium]
MKSNSATAKMNASGKKSRKGTARKNSGNSSKSVKRAKSPTYTEADADLAIYLFKNKSKRVIVKVFTIVLILGLCFTIIYPILSLVPVVFSRLEDLGNPNVIWIPEEFSLVSFKAAIRLVMPSGIWTIVKSVG